MAAQPRSVLPFPVARQRYTGGREHPQRFPRPVSNREHLSSLSYQDFCALAVTYMAPLYNAARRLTKDAQDAEDVVQDTYLRALRAYRQLERPSQCRAWLFQILHNVFVDLYRQQRTVQGLRVCDGDNEREDTLIASYPDSADGPEDQMLRRLSQEEVRSILATLPDDWRKIITLCDFDGLTYPEIADVLDCPVGTVRSRLARARRALLIKFRTRADNRELEKEGLS